MNEITLNQKQHDDMESVVDPGGSTFIIVAVQHKESSRNALNRISCKQGVPLAGHVYDAKQDCYFYPCLDYLMIGSVSAAAYMVSKSNGWSLRVPIALSLLHGLLDENQKSDLKNFVESYDPEQHVFKYLQLIDANESYPLGK